MGPFSDSRVDDLYVGTARPALPGGGRVITLRPAADTAQRDWAPDSGTDNYARVNETTVDGVGGTDASYVSAGTDGAIDLYELAELPYAPHKIPAVQAVMNLRKTSASGTSTARSKLKAAATVADGATHAIAGNATADHYNFYRHLWEQDPATPAPWSAAAADGLEVGLEAVGAEPSLRSTWVGAEVLVSLAEALPAGGAGRPTVIAVVA